MKKGKIRLVRKQRFSLTLLFSVFVFAVILAAIAIAASAVYIFAATGILSPDGQSIDLGTTILLMIGISLVIGWVISILLGGRIPLKPINDIINTVNRLAAGDFKTRLKFGKALSNHKSFNELSVSFNKLAEELENTEMLREDFINNFSHEFKTPIVSIAGLAKLVNKGDLTDEEKQQYLTAIEEESLRLANMATNVLNLTKIENQTILTDVSRFNLSEQIRSCVLLLENKWSSKEIDLQLDFDEYMIEANEELLKQVWINLTDNAIKFAPTGGSVMIEITDKKDHFSISVGNTGSEIPEEERERIFNKFYQADRSHATEGNGVGLAIVKRIVDLHGGEIEVDSADGVTTFTVELQKKK
ncbi:MAG: HAMP domain-containing histidine kinase [Clostridia bacterium]|nr:HAMP domain-containing histidine kinase [Clostridia bacterium]